MNKIFKNYIFNLLYQVLLVLVPFVTTPYVSRILGADLIGQYSFAQSVCSYFVLLAIMGTTLYGQRKIASDASSGTGKKQSFIEIILLRIVLTCTVYIVYYFSIIKTSGTGIYFLVSIEIVNVVADISWFYQGIEEFKVITYINGIFKILGTACIFIFVRSRNDLNLYIIIYGVSLLLGNVVQWCFLSRYLGKEQVNSLNIKKHIKPALALFVSQIAIQLYTVLDKTMIGVITASDSENGYYEQSQKLIKTIVAMITSIGCVMASRISYIWNSDDSQKKDTISKLITYSFQLVFCMGIPTAFGIMIIAGRFVPVFYGEGFEPVKDMISCLALIVPIIGCSNIIGMQLLVPTNRERLLTGSVSIGAIVNVVLNAVLISKLGGIGACYASVIAELVVTITQIWIVRKEIDLVAISRNFAKYFLYSFIMFGFGVGVSKIASDGIGGILLIVLLCVSIYISILALTRDSAMKFVVEQLKKGRG